MAWTRQSAIGHGSSATVYLATAVSSGELFAVKSADLLKSDFLKTEQRILSSLSHPSIVGYRGFDVTRENGKLMFHLFMEYAASGTLTDEIVRRGGRIKETAAAFYTRQIVGGLEYLHKQGFVHCDIKAKNILIGEDGLKIADFGCSKWVCEAEAVIGGTPMFMAPEVARGEKQGISSDIWSLGCTLIEMVTGAPPWPIPGDPVSVLYRIGYSGESPEIPSFLSEKAKDFLSKCLRRDATERWSANQLLEHPFLRELSHGFEEIKELHPHSKSPTSILDQSLWNSLKTESETLLKTEQWDDDDDHDDRIQRLASISGEMNLEFGDENWITIRNCVDSEDEDEDESMFRSTSEMNFRRNDLNIVEQGRIGSGKIQCLELLDKTVSFRVGKSNIRISEISTNIRQI
ncbi:mitogen-activated protein kinase kinase kinase 18 [Benincasa hispida]|uniref:mitogen-activated protein kinase kinase kinase 18 n=1 Tax=Benincasa hispida TaxID=102211 RepID=UPI001901721A|nr:mitogen-activated protein kinase kinase kinase 18 [Benincasa hispida]